MSSPAVSSLQQQDEIASTWSDEIHSACADKSSARTADPSKAERL